MSEHCCQTVDWSLVVEWSSLYVTVVLYRASMFNIIYVTGSLVLKSQMLCSN